VLRHAQAPLIGSAEDPEVVGEAADGRGGPALVRRTRPDVALATSGCRSSTAWVCWPRRPRIPTWPACAWSCPTTFELDEYVFEALRAGASCLLLKDADPARLLDAIRVVVEDGSPLAPSVTRRVIEECGTSGRASNHTRGWGSGRRGREIMEWVATGRSNQEIADELVEPRHRADAHVSPAMLKLTHATGPSWWCSQSSPVWGRANACATGSERPLPPGHL
jgi:DNA-binding NarL/FixJ family response regulator